MQCYPRGGRAAEVACQRRRTAINTDDRRRSNRTRSNAMILQGHGSNVPMIGRDVRLAELMFVLWH